MTPRPAWGGADPHWDPSPACWKAHSWHKRTSFKDKPLQECHSTELSHPDGPERGKYDVPSTSQENGGNGESGEVRMLAQITL